MENENDNQNILQEVFRNLANYKKVHINLGDEIPLGSLCLTKSDAETPNTVATIINTTQSRRNLNVTIELLGVTVLQTESYTKIFLLKEKE